MLKLKKLKPETTISSMGCADGNEKIIIETIMDIEQDTIILEDNNGKILVLNEEEIKKNINEYMNGTYRCNINGIWVNFLGLI
jgi:hypothetical protein